MNLSRRWLLLCCLAAACGCNVFQAETTPTPTPTPVATHKPSKFQLQTLPRPAATPLQSAEQAPAVPKYNPSPASSPTAGLKPAARPESKPVPSLDLNVDGHISLVEAKAARKRLDRDRDGFLNARERLAGRPILHSTDRAMRARIMDKDGDGVVSPSEWKDTWLPFDKDRDGELSADERDAMQAQWRSLTYDKGAYELLFARPKAR